jgi:hypothetical protein
MLKLSRIGGRLAASGGEKMRRIPFPLDPDRSRSALDLCEVVGSQLDVGRAEVLLEPVNVASAWLLSGGDHHHGHSHSHGLAQEGHDHDESHRITTQEGVVILEIFEDGVVPRFRLHSETGPSLVAHSTVIETMRPEGTRQQFSMTERSGYLESVEEIPVPHLFVAQLRIGRDEHSVVFEEHEHAHGKAQRDNNMRAAVIHVIADAAVSMLVIVGLLLARVFGWADGPIRRYRRGLRNRQLVIWLGS